MSSREPFRYSSRPFPPYTYVPGSGTPHPVSDPAGHMYGMEAAALAPLDPAHWQKSETYLYAVDLFNHCFFWEAHEAWESLWHAAGHRGQTADFLKALIKFAAAGVKFLEGNQAGVTRHLRRANELLNSLAHATFCGVDVVDLANRAAQSAAADAHFQPLIVLQGIDQSRQEGKA